MTTPSRAEEVTDTAEKLAEALAQIVLIEADSTTIAADKIRGAARIARAALDANRADRAKGSRRWPFVESPGEFTERLRLAMQEMPLIGAVRHVLIEKPPTLSANRAKGAVTDARISEIEDAVAANRMNAAQVFTQMRQLLESLPMLDVADDMTVRDRIAYHQKELAKLTHQIVGDPRESVTVAAAPKPEGE